MYNYNLSLRFEEVAEKYASQAAIKTELFDLLSYEQLNNLANKIARYLLSKNIKQKDVVCISGRKSIRSYACMLACLKIGAIYSIMDDKSPIERLRRIIARCLPRAIFLDSSLANAWTEIIDEFNINIIISDEEHLKDAIKRYSADNLEITKEIDGTNPAYIMFTSGSTGFPKGALMTHANVLNLISWSQETFRITSNDVLTNVNPLYFDNSVFDFYSALFSGACLVPFNREEMGNHLTVVNKIDELGCTLWFSVPSLLIYLDTMKILTKDRMKKVKRFVFGGEGYPKAKLKHLYDLYGDRSELFNVYGPTECTCICSVYKITAADFVDLRGLPPLGKMAKNFSCLILDDDNNKVGEGETGELCILGPNVGRGYYNDLERTREKYFQNPFNNKYDEIMYKSGDLVRHNPGDNNIYFVGRKDNQIKHMGYRIELEEIEAAVSRLDYIAQVAVIHGTLRGLSQIIAILSLTDNIDEERIRQDLKRFIPEYMIPNRIYTEKELPTNPNGKIDRRKLAEMYLA